MIINLRYLLIGASLRPLFQGQSLGHKMTPMHLVADENWAVTMAAQRSGGVSTAFLFGGCLCVLSAWCAGTLLGHRLGAVVQDPEAYALDFAFVAPGILAAGVWGAVAAAVTAALTWKTGNVFLAMLTVVAIVAAARQLCLLQDLDKLRHTPKCPAAGGMVPRCGSSRPIICTKSGRRLRGIRRETALQSCGCCAFRFGLGRSFQSDACISTACYRKG